MLRSFNCEYCGRPCSSHAPHAKFCSKQCADRSRNIHSDEPVSDLRIFSKLSQGEREAILLGEDERFKVVCFDFEATHLKANVGRILCCSFKPLGADTYTFSALEPRFRKADVYDDGALALAIIEELEHFDILIGWNSKQFDVKFINARSMQAGHRTKDKQYHVDGMWSWRSKAAAWSGLAAVQQFIDSGGAEKTSVKWDQWMRAIGWDQSLRESAMAEIIHHCELDVVVLEEVYKKLVEANVIRSIRADGGVL